MRVIGDTDFRVRDMEKEWDSSPSSQRKRPSVLECKYEICATARRCMAMTDENDNLVLSILRDIQARLGRVESRLTNVELRMTAQEQHLGAIVTSLPASHDRLDALAYRVERIEKRLELQD